MSDELGGNIPKNDIRKLTKRWPFSSWTIGREHPFFHFMKHCAEISAALKLNSVSEQFTIAVRPKNDIRKLTKRCVRIEGLWYEYKIFFPVGPVPFGFLYILCSFLFDF